MIPKIPINSVRVPKKFCNLCIRWNAGTGCMLYAVAYTNTVTIGSILRDGKDREQTYLMLWDELSNQIIQAMVRARSEEETNGDNGDSVKLFEFWQWTRSKLSEIQIGR